MPLARTEGGGLELEDGAERLWLRADIPAYREDIRDMVKAENPARIFCRNGSSV